jgi:hypothetical protein
MLCCDLGKHPVELIVPSELRLEMELRSSEARDPRRQKARLEVALAARDELLDD